MSNAPDGDMVPIEAKAAIAQYDAMRVAIKECHDIDVARQMQSQAAALATYHAQANDTESEHLMREIRIRAQRRAGEILAQMKADGTRRQQHVVVRNPEADSTAAPTLAALGVTAKESSNWQALAKVPEPVFEQHLSKARQAGAAPAMRHVAAIARGMKPHHARAGARTLAACLARLCELETDPAQFLALYPNHERVQIKQRLDTAIAILTTIQRAWRD